MAKAKTTRIEVDAVELEVVRCFRRLKTKHSRLAFLLLLQSAAQRPGRPS